ncbi:MAG: DUF2242 domain-containing protein [Gammaproteobacteria bacterium]|nr:DUF2242 domain-containing protein [Gammaproteobacteria bacterium]
MNTIKLSSALVAAGALALTGCSAPTGYDKAFSQTTALSGNSHSFNATADQVFRTVKITLVQRGFTIEQADAQSGLIRGGRALQDVKDAKLAYLISSTIDISPAPAGNATIVTMSAAQQTVLHKDSNTYYKLLGLVPIPTGKDYQTVVRREGTIGTRQFYDDFFEAVNKNLSQLAATAAPIPETHLAVAVPVSDTSARSIATSAPAPLQMENAASTGATSHPLDPAAAPAPPAKPAGAELKRAPDADAASPLVEGPNPFAQPAADKPQ